MPRVVAIHQPNFFPWLGYFDKIARSDVFIFLDDVQYQKTGAVWTNRVRLLISGEARWVTAALDRNFHGTRNVNEMKFLMPAPWPGKLLRSIDINYRNHPFYAETMEIIEPLILQAESDVSRYNGHAIGAIANRLGLDTKRLRWASGMSKTGTSNERLATLTLAAGGHVYMCGGGADDYQDRTLFERLGVTLVYQDFEHPRYVQKNAQTFTPGLSVIDAAMNLGWSGVTTLLAGDSIAAT
jgi:hypothetical protein